MLNSMSKLDVSTAPTSHVDLSTISKCVLNVKLMTILGMCRTSQLGSTRFLGALELPQSVIF